MAFGVLFSCLGPFLANFWRENGDGGGNRGALEVGTTAPAEKLMCHLGTLESGICGISQDCMGLYGQDAGCVITFELHGLVERYLCILLLPCYF